MVSVWSWESGNDNSYQAQIWGRFKDPFRVRKDCSCCQDSNLHNHPSTIHCSWQKWLRGRAGIFFPFPSPAVYTSSHPLARHRTWIALWSTASIQRCVRKPHHVTWIWHVALKLFGVSQDKKKCRGAAHLPSPTTRNITLSKTVPFWNYKPKNIR